MAKKRPATPRKAKPRVTPPRTTTPDYTNANPPKRVQKDKDTDEEQPKADFPVRFEPVLRGVRMSDSIKQLATAVVKFQGDQSVAITKDSTGYGYDYLSLAGLLEGVQDNLKKSGLAVMQFPVSAGTNDLGVSTILIHNSGEWIESEYVMPLPSLSGGANITQKAGAAITYARRYALSCVLRVVADEDTDGE